MSDDKKDLSYYLTNPDELGNLSDDQIEALASSPGKDPGVDPADDKGDTQSAKSPDGAAAVGTEQDDEQQKPDDKQPDGILARDGKHIIPYARLEEAQRRASELAAKVEELTKQASGKPAADDKQDDQPSTDEFLSDAELDELEAELPALAKVIRAQQAQVRKLEQTVSTLTKDREVEQQREAEAEAKSWEEALAKNPKAQYLDATLPVDVGQRFINAAAALNENWNTMTHEERAAAIVRQYEAVHGEVKVQSVASKPAQQPSGQQKPAKPDVPISMSGIPGGSAPAVDEAAALAGKTGAELTMDFMKMTPEQIEAQLNRI